MKITANCILTQKKKFQDQTKFRRSFSVCIQYNNNIIFKTLNMFCTQIIVLDELYVLSNKGFFSGQANSNYTVFQKSLNVK